MSLRDIINRLKQSTQTAIQNKENQIKEIKSEPLKFLKKKAKQQIAPKQILKNVRNAALRATPIGQATYAVSKLPLVGKAKQLDTINRKTGKFIKEMALEQPAQWSVKLGKPWLQDVKTIGQAVNPIWSSRTYGTNIAQRQQRFQEQNKEIVPGTFMSRFTGEKKFSSGEQQAREWNAKGSSLGQKLGSKTKSKKVESLLGKVGGLVGLGMVAGTTYLTFDLGIDDVGTMGFKKASSYLAKEKNADNITKFLVENFNGKGNDLGKLAQNIAETSSPKEVLRLLNTAKNYNKMVTDNGFQSVGGALKKIFNKKSVELEPVEDGVKSVRNIGGKVEEVIYPDIKTAIKQENHFLGDITKETEATKSIFKKVDTFKELEKEVDKTDNFLSKITQTGEAKILKTGDDINIKPKLQPIENIKPSKKDIENFLSKEESLPLTDLMDEINFKAEQRATKINSDIITGIKNNPIYRKEQTIPDITGEGWLMQKGKTKIVADPQLAQNLEKKGYQKIIEIDSLAQEAGHENGINFLNEQIELSSYPTRKVTLEELAKKEVPKEDIVNRMIDEAVYKDIKGQEGEVGRLTEKDILNEMFPQKTLQQLSIIENKPLVKPPKGFREGGVISHLKASEDIPEEFKKGLSDVYEIQKQPEIFKQALEEFNQKGYGDLKEDWIRGKYSGAMDSSVAHILIQKAIDLKDWKTAQFIGLEAGKKVREMGRASSIWNYFYRLSPEKLQEMIYKIFEESDNEITLFDRIFKIGNKKILKNEVVNGKEIKLLPDDILEEIRKVSLKLGGTTNELEKGNIFNKLMEKVSAKIPSHMSDIITAYRYNNMLSNLRSFLVRNVWGPIFNGLLLHPAETFMRANIDMIASLWGKPKDVYFKDIPIYYWNMIKGLPNAMEYFKQGFKKGLFFDQGVQAKTVVEMSRRKNVPKSLKLVSGTMEGLDSLTSGIIADGIKNVELSKGKSIEEAEKIAKDISDKLLYRESLNKEGLGKVNQFLNDAGVKLIEFGDKHPSIRWSIPFMKIPLNSFKMGIEYTPGIGMVNMINNANKRSALAKQMVGSFAFYYGAELAQRGMTTWNAPTGEKEKQLWMDTGRKPKSVKIGDKWIPMYYFGPLMFALGIPAAYKEVTDQALKKQQQAGLDEKGQWKEQTSRMENMAMGLIKSFSMFKDIPFINGFSNLVSLVDENKNWNIPYTISSTFSQLVPMAGAMRFIENMVDTTVRKPSGNFTQKITQNIMKDIPGLSKYVESVKRSDGKDLKKERWQQFLPYDVGTNYKFKDIYGQKTSAEDWWDVYSLMKELDRVTSLPKSSIKNVPTGSIEYFTGSMGKGKGTAYTKMLEQQRKKYLRNLIKQAEKKKYSKSYKQKLVRRDQKIIKQNYKYNPEKLHEVIKKYSK